MAEISVQAPGVVEIGNLSLSSSVVASFSVTLLLAILIFIVVRKSKLIPGRLQLSFELLFGNFYGLLLSAYGTEKRARTWMAFYITLFVFIGVANQFSLIPFLGSVVKDGVAVFRTPTSDLSQTLVLALVSILGAHVIAFSLSPWKHVNNFIKIEPFFKIRKISDLGNAFMELFLGFLDIVGEFAKVISLSARLFGNIFAGDVIVAVISGIAFFTPYVVPFPFIGLSVFSSLVQAFVFVILSMQFMAGTITAVLASRKEEHGSSQALETSVFQRVDA